MPTKVAIIGGGCAAITAAFELTRPEQRGKYAVTVYQVGWRLGGKGASGRGPADRIEEHGLHLWMGWYENAFRLMRECYAELARDPRECPIADWSDAFSPVELAGLLDVSDRGDWTVWQASLPPAPGLPGDPDNGPLRWSVLDYMTRALDLLRVLLQTLQATDATASSEATADYVTSTAILDQITRLLRYGELATLTGLLQGLSLLQAALRSLTPDPDNILIRFLDAIAASARGMLESRLQNDLTVRRVWHVIDLTIATMRGVIRAGIITDPRGFDALDEYDCREWLLLSGAAESSVNSGWLRALYDFGFSYENGDPHRPRIAASQGLRAMVRAFFTYRGAFFWRMQAGMGDVVFAPFYEVLRRRGVRFEFFHRLENVKLAESNRLQPGEHPYVEALEMSVQAEILGGGEYHPLVDVHGLPCWPSTPAYDQLVDGDRLRREEWAFESHWEQRCAQRKTLRVIDDFDFVVLGVGLGAIPHVCREIVARDPRWRAMVDHVKTVATQAMQIWMSADMEELGWVRGQTVLSGFTEPFDTWADMRHLIRQERWKEAPRALAYFCSVLGDESGADPNAASYVERRRDEVRGNAIAFLNRDVSHLWPNAVRNGQFRWDILVAPNGRADAQGPARFDSQFWTANVNPSDRYALSLPGTSAYRISPLDNSYDNLTVAGDWTNCSFNAGCVEAAVMSGRLAAHALSRFPPLEDIVGFDHP